MDARQLGLRAGQAQAQGAHQTLSLPLVSSFCVSQEGGSEQKVGGMIGRDIWQSNSNMTSHYLSNAWIA